MVAEEFRLEFQACRHLLLSRLDETPARVQILVGPRQVGKTTLLLEIAEHHADVSLYAAVDGPEASVPGFWERLWTRAEETARTRRRAIVLLDEVHALHDWSAKLKGEWDRLRRSRLHVHVVATGSSALRVTKGSRESLAGRFERITLAHWSPTALAAAFGVGEVEAVDEFVRTGSYPGAFSLRADKARWSAYVHDAILEPAIGRDILALAAVRKPALLRQVFGVCASSPAQIVSLQKIQGQLRDAGALATVAHYLGLLEQAFLVAALDKHSERAARRRAAPPKLVTLNNALLAVVDPRGIPEPSTDPARFGAWVENACLAHAWNRGQRVSYWREEPHEVDAVVDGTWGAWAIEVKTGAVSTGDLRGLGEFTRRYPAYRPLVLCDDSERTAVERAGMSAMHWRDFLLRGPPGAR